MAEQLGMMRPGMPTIKVVTNKSSFSSLQDDADFHAMPINPPAQASDCPAINPTQLKNQLVVDRTPSALEFQVAALSRKLSGNSSLSASPTLSFAALSPLDGQVKQVVPVFSHSRDASDDLSHHNSVITIRERYSYRNRYGVSHGPSSTKSSPKSTRTRSVKSVNSIQAIGAFELGTLRVHSISPPTVAHMETNECLKRGDVIIVRDLPLGTVFGYDARSFCITKGEGFEGVKELPAGAHFVWAGAEIDSTRAGFWLISPVKGTIEHGQIIVKRWDSDQEILDNEYSAAERYNQKNSIPEFLDKLHPYDADPVGSSGGSDLLAKFPSMWIDLTSSIKGVMLARITGHKIWNKWHVSTNHEIKRDPEKKHIFAEREDEVFGFIFPKETRTFSPRAIGRERTEQAMDTSSYVASIINTKCTYEDSDEIIGEIQFCYITGMVLGNLACVEHWGHVVKMVFKAIRLTLDLPTFFTKFIKAVQTQLIYDDAGFEGSIFDYDCTLAEELKVILTTFKSRFNELVLSKKLLTDDQKAVCKAFDEFESWLWKFGDGWDLRGSYVRSGKVQLEDGEIIDAELSAFQAEDERGEFAPVMVELDEDGREKGLIRF